MTTQPPGTQQPHPGPYPPPVSPGPYGQPYPQQVVVVQGPPTSGLAVASLVLAILGLLVGWCMLGIPSIIAVILGHSALNETKSGQKGGHGMAVAGLIMGYVIAGPTALFGIFAVIGAVSNG